MEILDWLQRHLLAFATDVLRVIVWLFLLMAVFVPLERLFAIHPQKLFRKSFPADLGFYFLNSLLPNLLLIVPSAFLAWGVRYVVPGGVHAWVAGMPTWTRLVAALVVGEFGFYWGHRWAHEIPLVWRFHSVHHSAEEIDWLVNSRAHPLDLVFVRLCGFVPMYALGLAQPMRGQRLDTVPLLVMLVGMMWGFFVHANLRWRFGWLEFLISTPAFHHWHHTKEDHINKNYASMLPFMDRLFGTWYMPKRQWPVQYGISPQLDYLAGTGPGRTSKQEACAPSPPPHGSVMPASSSKAGTGPGRPSKQDACAPSPLPQGSVVPASSSKDCEVAMPVMESNPEGFYSSPRIRSS
jgi:sterol desaturase/sphingolipid hydroxylase (fatty acid hydroxylase superfamily)